MMTVQIGQEITLKVLAGCYYHINFDFHKYSYLEWQAHLCAEMR